VVKVSKAFKALAAVAALAVGFGQFSPAVAAPKTVVTIWSFGNVIRPELVTEYEAANPDISIVVKKSELDPHHNSLITAMLAKTHQTLQPLRFLTLATSAHTRSTSPTSAPWVHQTCRRTI